MYQQSAEFKERIDRHFCRATADRGCAADPVDARRSYIAVQLHQPNIQISKWIK
jgi:hypothetical protein